MWKEAENASREFRKAKKVIWMYLIHFLATQENLALISFNY